MSDLFIKEVSSYFQNFLETDFRKRRLPKRSIKATDRAGNKITLNLQKYTKFRNHLVKKLSNPKIFDFEIDIPRGKYTSPLRTSTIEFLKKKSSKLSLESASILKEGFNEILQKIYLKNAEDIEKFKDEIGNEFQRLINEKLISEIIGDIKNTIERKAENLTEYDELENNLTEAVFHRVEEQAMIDCDNYFISKDKDLSYFDSSFDIIKESDIVSKTIGNFLESYSTSDLLSELSEFQRISKLKDNLQAYIYLGEISYENHSFPLLFIPFDITENYKEKKRILTIKFEKQFVINKHAIEFVYQQCFGASMGISSILKDRIVSLSEEEDISSKSQLMFNKIASKFNIDIDFESLFNALEVGKNEGLAIKNTLFFSIFEKGDESTINDYEELINMLNEDHDLAKDFSEIINGIIRNDPINIENNIDDRWDSSSVSDRLVFPSPIPVNEEQRKIIEAVKDKKSKYITVEGPPGTGKSHTITAMMFDAIRNNQSVLMLSDKKEALDVVEDKLTQTLNKIRPEPDKFQNPILRIGKSGNSYAKIFNRQTIENIRSHFRATSTALKSTEFKNNLEDELKKLKNDIRKNIASYDKIHLKDIEELFLLKSKLNINDDNEKEYINKGKDLKNELKVLKKLYDTYKNLSDITKQSIKEELKKDKALKINDVLDALQLSVNLLDSHYGLKTSENFKSLKIDDQYTLKKLIKKYKKAKEKFLFWLLGSFYLNKWNEEINNSFKLRKTESSSNEEVNFVSDKGVAILDAAYKTLIALEKKYPDNTQLKNYMNKIIFSKKVKYDYLENRKHINSFIKHLLEYQKITNKNPSQRLDIPICNNFLVASNYRKTIKSISDIVSFATKSIEIQKNFDKIKDVRYSDQTEDIQKDSSLEMARNFDERFLDFAQNFSSTASTFKKIITKKLKFPKDDFDKLKNAFPCIIAGIRDYADYIPLEKELFDLLIIDEASQVSIAQAFPAILRSKKIVVLGDKRQFSNVKSSTASKIQNQSWQRKIQKSFRENYGTNTLMVERSKIFNIQSSILDFFEYVKNYSAFLKKHFRGYPELISFSSKYFYQGGLQTIKVRAKPIEEVLSFDVIDHDNLLDMAGNINVLEAQHIIKKLEKLCKEENPMTVGIITPFRDQQKYIVGAIDKSEHRSDIITKLKVKVMTFDSCQGEERDHIIYSMVATEARDMCYSVLGKNFDLDTMDPETNLRLQRLNVGMSRAKEKMTFVVSKPIEKFSGNALLILNHYKQEIELAKKTPDTSKADSEMEKKLQHWITQTKFYQMNKDKIELIPQFKVGKYLKSLNSSYEHPHYRCDFLMTFTYKDKPAQKLIIEYDGFEYHFNKKSNNINEYNYQFYYTDQHVEREKVLESYGFPFLRINRFILKGDPVEVISDKLENFFFAEALESDEQDIIKVVKKKTAKIIKEEERWCDKCKKLRPKVDFIDDALVSGYGRFCVSCKDKTRKDYNKKRAKRRPSRAKKSTKKTKSTATRTMKACPKCGSGMVRRTGKWGTFWGCKRFPYCRGTRQHG